VPYKARDYLHTQSSLSNMEITQTVEVTNSQLIDLSRLLDSFGIQRTPFQKQIHLGMAKVMGRKIESDAHNFMVMMPKRYGKTTAVALFAAALSIAVPGIQLAIYACGLRKPRLLLEQIETLLVAHGSTTSKISVSPHTRLQNITQCGFQRDVVILDDAAYISHDIWTAIIVPFMEVQKTPLIAISMLLEAENVYSSLPDLEDKRGKSVFEVLELHAPPEAQEAQRKIDAEWEIVWQQSLNWHHRPRCRACASMHYLGYPRISEFDG
jgi:hypothetical protein